MSHLPTREGGHYYAPGTSASALNPAVASVPRPFAYAFSAETAKVIHLVRHGQGHHNLEAALIGAAAYKKQSLMDARLDETGRAQAIALGQRIREAHMVVDVVLVSPLTRTLETGSLMFMPDYPLPPAVSPSATGTGTGGASHAGAGATASSASGSGAGGASARTGGGSAASSSSSSSSSSALTLAAGSGTGSPAVHCPVPFVAVELCREAHGGHPCDQRRPVSAVGPEFPHVDFTGVGTDEDTWHNPDRRETVREVSIRCDKFLHYLRTRPERNIVVVSHGVFLETLLNRCGLLCTDDGLKGKRFENAEMRSVVLGGWA